MSSLDAKNISLLFASGIFDSWEMLSRWVRLWSTNVGLSVVKVGKLKCYCNALVYFQSGALSCQTYMKMTNELSIEPFILIYDFFRRWTPRRKLLAADPVKLQSASCSLSGWFTVRDRYLPTEIQEKSVMWMENLSECWSC